MRATIVAVLLLTGNAIAGQPGRVAINISAGFIQEDLFELSHEYSPSLGPASSFSAAVEVFNRTHWLSLQAGFTYNHNTLTDETYDEHMSMSTYTPSLMFKVAPIRRARWLWAGVRAGAVRVVHTDFKPFVGDGRAAGWGYLTQGNVILVITQSRHLAIDAEGGYQIAHVNHIEFSHPDRLEGPLSYRLNYDLSGPRFALGVSLFP